MGERSRHTSEGGSPAGLAATRLDNGVWILCLPTPAPAPGYRGVVSVQLWIGAGASSERAREHGCAHLLEHMVFKPQADGEGRRRDLAGVVEQLGGDINAFTSHDETVFHATIPADSFTEVLDTMVGAVIGRRFDPELLAREQEVVVEEIRQYADDPSARSVQLMMSDLYGDHAYARPVLGEEHEVRALTAGILQGWGRRQHRGARVVLVVAGPVAEGEVEAAGRRLLAGLPEGKRARPPRAPSPASEAQVRVQRDEVQEAYLRLGWIGGTALDLDGVALDVAAVALGQGESSRLALGVRRGAQLVSDAYASYLSGLSSGTFMISAQAEPDRVEAATEALLEEIDALAAAPLGSEEFERARVLLRSSLVYRRESVQGQAHALGYFATISGELGAEARYFEILAQLDPAAVQAACARHLRREHAAAVLIVPRERVTSRRAKALARRLRRLCRPARAARQGSGVGARGWELEPPAAGGFEIWRARHRCGLRVVARRDASVPVVAGWLVWAGGLRGEPARYAGISSLTAALLNRGTSSRDGDTLAREIEGRAAVLDGFSGHNSVGLQSESLAGHLHVVLARALECAVDPRFAAEELEEARRIVLADLEADADDPGHQAYRTMLAVLYGRHPLGRDLRGSAETLARVTPAQLARNWSSRYPIHAGTLALAGDFELDAVLAHLDRQLERLGVASPGPARPPSWPGAPPKWRRRPVERSLQREREQGQCIIGFPGLSLRDPACAILDVLCSVLGGQAGRLFETLREREGLVYQVGASSSEHIDGGHLVFYAAASQDKLDAARTAIETQLAGLCEGGITAAELERAKRWLVGQFESGLQRRSRVASRMVFAEVYGLGATYYLRYPERVAAVTRPQLLALARRLLDPKRQVTVLVRA